MSLKSYEELKDLDLKGYCYYVDAWGMSMTSRHSYSPELWIVLEDTGTECVVSAFDNQSWTEKRSKDNIARAIAGYPAISSETNKNLIKK